MSIVTSKSGYTFVEACAVLSIIIIVSLIAMPPLKQLIASIRSKTTTTKITKLFNVAKIRALSDPNLHAGIFMDTIGAPDSIVAFLDNNSDNKFTSGTDRLLAQILQLPPSDTLVIPTGFQETIIFRGDGSVKTSAKLFIRNSRNKQISTITVLASTGRIKLTQGTN
jgi:Tfp pilus assembly protein FimT